MFTSTQPMLQEKRINAFLRMKLEVFSQFTKSAIVEMSIMTLSSHSLVKMVHEKHLEQKNTSKSHGNRQRKINLSVLADN